MKVYLAGPMRGYDNLNHPAFFAWADALRVQGHEVFNPAAQPLEQDAIRLNEDLSFRRKVFKLDTAWICEHADAVALMPGWEKSDGAVAECALAKAIGLPIIILGENNVV